MGGWGKCAIRIVAARSFCCTSSDWGHCLEISTQGLVRKKKKVFLKQVEIFWGNARIFWLFVCEMEVFLCPNDFFSSFSSSSAISIVYLSRLPPFTKQQFSFEPKKIDAFFSQMFRLHIPGKKEGLLGLGREKRREGGSFLNLFLLPELWQEGGCLSAQTKDTPPPPSSLLFVSRETFKLTVFTSSWHNYNLVPHHYEAGRGGRVSNLA